MHTINQSNTRQLPDYENSIASIPDSIIELLTGEQQQNSAQRIDTSPSCSTIILFVIDGLGNRQLERYNDSLITNLGENGQQTTLTTVYPSSTAAAMTSLYLGEPPASHGIVEWYTYLPAINDIVEPFPFVDSNGNDLYDTYGITASDIASGTSIFTRLEQRDITTKAFLPAAIAANAGKEHDFFYTETTAHGYHTLADLVSELETTLATGPPPFTFVYIPALDTVSHHRGPHSTNHAQQLQWIEHILAEVSASIDDDTHIAITADHGHIDLSDSTYYNISQIDGIEDSIKTGRHDTALVSGLHRDMQIHTDESERVKRVLEHHLEGCSIHDPHDLYHDGLFGPSATDQVFSNRLGDLIILPDGANHAWIDDTWDDMIGSHGGLSPDEMIVPFIMATGAQLKACLTQDLTHS